MGPNSLLFDNVDSLAIADIVGRAHQKCRQAGEAFFREGDSAGEFFVLTRGHVKLTRLMPDGHEITLRLVGPGAPFGSIDGLGPSTYSVTAEAAETSDALSWTSGTMRQVLEINGTLALNTARLMASRLDELQQRYCQVMTEPVERRVARALLRLIGVAGRRGETGIEVEFPVSRQDIAEMAGTTLFTVSRLLRAWQKRGVLRGGRQRIILVRPQVLTSIADGPSGPPD